MIEKRKYYKGLEKEIFLTRVRFSKDTPLSRVERDYYENLKPDWFKIERDRNDEEFLNKCMIELREAFVKHAVEYLYGANETGPNC